MDTYIDRCIYRYLYTIISVKRGGLLKRKQYPATSCRGQKRENFHRRDLGNFQRDYKIFDRKFKNL